MQRLIASAVILVVLASSILIAQSPWTTQTTNTTNRIRCIRALSDQLIWASGNSGTVLRTTNGGTTWEVKTVPNASFNFYCVDALDAQTALVIGTDAAVSTTGDTRIYKTTDGGTTWTQKYQSTDSYGDGIRFFDNNVGIAFGDPTSTRKSIMLIVKTTDAGESWSQVPEAAIPPVDSAADEVGVGNGFDVVGDAFFIATYGNSNDMPYRILKTTDRGTTWSLSPFVQMDNSYSISMKDVTTGIVCNYNGQVARTNDGWFTSDVDTLFTGTYGLRGIDHVPGTNSIVVVGGPTSTGFSAASLDGGATWTQQTLPAGVQRLYAVVFTDASTGWAGGNGGIIVKWTGSPLTGVGGREDGIPSEFSLEQNYPNPFNPSTTIRFALPMESQVSLKVYDLLGQLVATIQEGMMNAGTHTLTFDASNLPSGLYLYTVQAGGFASTRKMLLLK